MPSHSVIPSPLASRNLSLGRTDRITSVKQRLGEKFPNSDMVKRSLANEFNEWNDWRVWNGNISGGPGGSFSEPQPAPPPPPENLNWNTPYRRREMSPNIESFMNFNDQPPLVCEPEYNNAYVGPEPFALNDYRHSRETPADVYPPQEPLDSFSSGGYHSFENRRGDSNLMESSSSSFNYLSPREYSGQRGQGMDQWGPFESSMQVARRQRRNSSPRGPGRSSDGPEMSDKVFNIGGYKLPYITNGVNSIPQPESRSLLVRFLKKNPLYRISLKKGRERTAVEHVYVESVDVNELEEGGGKHFSLYRFREEITKEFTKIYRGRDYRNWDGWWKDFHNINLDIDEQLAKFEDFNVKYNFMPSGGTIDFADIINRAKVALTKNRNNYLGNMRLVYSLMNHIIVGNMPMELVAQLQDLIRSVPNHLWIYKLRSMVYLWYNYKQVMDNKNSNEKNCQYVTTEWKSPVIHWVAKQAFLELRNISQVEFPEFNKLYGKSKDTKA